MHPPVEHAARLAMPAVTPAEPHNPQRYRRSHAIQPARLRAPPHPAAPRRCRAACPSPLFPSPCPPCSLWFVFSVPSVSCPMPCPVGADQRVRPFSSDLRALPCSRKAAAARWSKPPGLPCRRSRRQSHTIPNATGVPTPSGPHDCALHLRPPRRVDAVQRPRPLSSPLRVLRVLCGLFFLCPPCRVRCGAGFLAGLGALYPPPLLHPIAPPRGARRQACHAGGHAGRATQSRTLRELQRHPARKTARSTSSRRAA